MNVRRSDVVLIDYPFSDRTGSKLRPCLVVQNDRNNHRLDDTIVVTISRTTHRVAAEPTQLLIEVHTPTGKQSGLLFDSAVQRENILTIDHRFILQKINECLRVSLGLP